MFKPSFDLATFASDEEIDTVMLGFQIAVEGATECLLACTTLSRDR